MVTSFGLFRCDHRAGRITVTIHLLDVPEDGISGSLIVRQPDENGVLSLQYVILVTIINGHHCHDVILDLRHDTNPEYNLIAESLTVFLTLWVN